jgi:hypothetical protein
LCSTPSHPNGRDKGRESTIVAECDSAEAAFAEIERLAEQMLGTGASPDQIELLVVNERREILPAECNSVPLSD